MLSRTHLPLAILAVLLVFTLLPGCVSIPWSPPSWFTDKFGKQRGGEPKDEVIPPPASLDTSKALPDPRSLSSPDIGAYAPPPDESGAPPPSQQPSPPKDLWEVIRAGAQWTDLENPAILQALEMYTASPTHLQRLGGRAQPYLYFIVDEIMRRGMPLDLALLPGIESGFAPRVYSSAKAAGIWQFMPATGRSLGLEQNAWYDGRLDIIAATHAALDYLQALHKRFDGDWFHALAAYNSGALTVRRAIIANQEAGKPTDFWSLELPPETRKHVPRLIALVHMVNHPERYGQHLEPVANQSYFSAIEAEGYVPLKALALRLDSDLTTLHTLNPAFLRSAAPPEDRHLILVPASRAIGAFDIITKIAATSSPDRHLVRPGDTLSGIAIRYNVTVDALQQVNALRGTLIRVGRALKIPNG